MTASRKAFIVRTAALGVIAALPARLDAQAASPKPTPTPSPASMEAALHMRTFDKSLTDEQIRDIARGIDEQNDGGTRIGKRQPLKNGDEPSPEFAVPR